MSARKIKVMLAREFHAEPDAYRVLDICGGINLGLDFAVKNRLIKQDGFGTYVATKHGKKYLVEFDKHH